MNGAGVARLPNTTSLMLEGCDSESMVIGLDLEGVAVSGGSACSSGRVEGSPVLLEMGLSESEAKSSFRISLSRETTSEEIDRFLEILERVASTARNAAQSAPGSTIAD